MTLRVAMTRAAGSIAAAQAATVAFLRDAGQTEATASRAELLIEEVALNALGHGGASEVTLLATTTPVGSVLTFEDSGAAFDPTTVALPTAATSLADARIGGLGLVLVNRLAATIRYERVPPGRNRLELTLAR